MTHESKPAKGLASQRPFAATSELFAVDGRVRSVAITESDHLSCTLGTAVGRLHAISDASSAHLPTLSSSARVRVVLLRTRRFSKNGRWGWQLLACKALGDIEDAAIPSSAERTQA